MAGIRYLSPGNSVFLRLMRNDQLNYKTVLANQAVLCHCKKIGAWHNPYISHHP
jgi:hypothetical protein